MSTECEPEVRDALRQARNLLSSVTNPEATQGSRGAAERVLETAFRLLESVYTTIGSGKSMTLSASDSTVVKAILELLVRWGIYPHLSPGVGIPLERRFGAKSAASAAAALTAHVSGESSSGPSSEPFLGLGNPSSAAAKAASNTAPTPLLQSAELLAGLILDSNPESKQSSELLETDFANKNLQPPSKNVEGNNLPEGGGGESLNQANQFPAAALHQLVIFHHLPDLCAAFLQLSVSGKDEWKKLATERMNEMVRFLPVAHLVEALLVLLGQRKPEPPTWLKERAGRMLSKLLLREGGVAASMERLVGGIQEGNVKAYEHLATHLAKIPKYITTTENYYSAVCPQLPPLFLAPLPGQQHGLKPGTSAARLDTNMHHAAVILACKLASRDITLCGEYLLTPLLLRPLLRFGMQTQNERMLLEDSTEQDHGEDDGEERELGIVNAVLGMHVFFTAGHDGADCVREFLVPRIAPVSAVLLALRTLLDGTGSASLGKEDKRDEGASHHSAQDTRTSSSQTTKPAFAKGFLENQSLGYAAAEGPSTILDKLRAALSDITELLQEEQMLVPQSVPASSVLDAVRMKWPRRAGEIWEALNSDR